MSCELQGLALPSAQECIWPYVPVLRAKVVIQEFPGASLGFDTEWRMGASTRYGLPAGWG